MQGFISRFYLKLKALNNIFCGGLCQTAYLGANSSHAVQNLIRMNSWIHRCPQNKIGDKPSHQGLHPLLFSNSVWVL